MTASHFPISLQSPSAPAMTGMDAKTPLAVRGLLYAFLFSLPSENYNPLGISHFFTISKMIGLLLLAATCLLDWRIFVRGCDRAVTMCFVVLGVILLATIIHPGHGFLMSLILMLTFLQGVGLMWICCGAFREERVATNALWWLVIGCFFASILVFLGIGTETHYASGRAYFLGKNPNAEGNLNAYGVIICLGLFFRSSRDVGWKRFAGVIPVPIMLLGIGASGSRGAVAGCLLGILPWLLQPGNALRKIGTWLFAGLFFVVAFHSLFQSELVKKRWLQTIESQNLAGRQTIYSEAWQMFLDRPLLGWGLNGAYEELGSREKGGSSADNWRAQHNDLLWILTTAGVLGFIPTSIVMYWIVGAAWRSRSGVRGILPLSLLLMALFFGFKGGSWESKITWVVFAYALTATGSPAAPCNMPVRLRNQRSECG